MRAAAGLIDTHFTYITSGGTTGMSDYPISEVYRSDRRANREVDALLTAEGIRRDRNLDYTCGMYDENGHIIATGSCFGNTLRCLAVSREHQGEGLMNEIITHLLQVQYERGNVHLFLYTKESSSKFFNDLGFREIARIPGLVVFMENRRTGFRDYLENLKKETDEQLSHLQLPEPVSPAKIAAIVVNANPFTLGHLYLVEKASRENDLVHLFIVSEDKSLFPFSVRQHLVKEGTAHLSNIVHHRSGSYIISNATFPGYFQKDSLAVMQSHAELDLTIFLKIAAALNIHVRYVGEENTSEATVLYNKVMAEKLPLNGIRCVIVPRKKQENGRPVSASSVRQAIKDGKMEDLKAMVPPSTLNYLLSAEAEPVLSKIRNAENVIHD